MLKAVIGGSTLVIYADGSADPSEYDSLRGIISAHDKLKHFGSEIDTTINEYQRLFLAGATTATVKVFQEIADFTFSSEESNEIVAVLIDVAKANGRMDSEEEDVVRKIAQRLNVDVSMFGL